MSALTNEQVAHFLGNMSVMDVIALTRELEHKWGLEAKPQLVQMQVAPREEATQVVQTEFNVILVSFPADKKMSVVKLVREVVGLGLLESKNLVESVPKTLKEGLSKEDAEILKARFVEIGTTVEVK